MNAKDLFIALFVPLSWGLGFVAAKAGLGHFPPLLLMSLRFFISSILIVWFLPIPKEYLLKIFYISLVSATLQYGLTFSGLKILDTSTAALLVQTEVVFGIITAAIFLKEIPTKKQLLGIVIACSGTIILLGTPSVEGKALGASLVPYLFQRARPWGTRVQDGKYRLVLTSLVGERLLSIVSQ